MPNNFKLSGDYYVSKFGNDSWSGTSPDAPKRTIQAAITAAGASVVRRIIIGAGVYNETIAINLATGSSILGDGYVVIDGLNYRSITFTTATQGSLSYYDIEFRNYNGSGSTMLSGVNRHDFYRCRFINCSYTTSNSASFGNFAQVFIQCIFISCNFGTPTNLIFQFYYTSCILINSYVVSTSQLLNCYVNSSSVVAYSLQSGAPVASLINYNNIQGTNIINYLASTVTSGVIQDTYGRYYDLSIATSTGNGTIGNPYGRPYTNGAAFSFSNHRIAYPTMNASSSAVDPKFNSMENYDFTLASDSPMIGRASDGVSNIGGTRYAVRNPANSTAFSGSSATVDSGLTFAYTNYVISGSSVTGSVTSAPILVNNLSPKVVQRVTYNGLLAFNKDTGSASGSNVNVPDFDTYTSASGNAGANPDRLVYYMRFTSGSSVPVSDSGWENAGLWAAGTYNVFEWNTKPSIDLSGRGNGNPLFNAADTPTFITAQWIQVQVKLRNDYLL